MALISWWKLDGNTEDSTHNSNDGNVVSAIVSNNGKIGKCYYFDGQDNFQITHDKSLNCPFIVSASVWFKTDSTSLMTLLGKHYEDYEIAIEDNRLLSWYGGSDGWKDIHWTLSQTLADNEWHHVAWVCNKKEAWAKSWVDGEFVSKQNDSPSYGNNLSDLYIGSRLNASQYFSGYINDVRVYNHALSEKEVKEISQAKILHYKFNDFQEPTTNLRVTDTMVIWESSSGTVGNISDATEIGSEWKKINFTQLGTNFRLAKFEYTSMPPGSTRTFSMDFFSPHADYFVKIDGTGVAGTGPYLIGENRYYTVVFNNRDDDIVESLFIMNNNNNRVCDETVYYRWYQVEDKDHPTPYVESNRGVYLTDSSGYNRYTNTANSQFPVWVQSSSLGQGCYELDGTNYISITNDFLLQDPILQEWTVSAWVKIEEIGSSQKLVNFNKDLHLEFDTTSKMLLYLNSGDKDYYVYSDEVADVYLYDNRWHHVSFVFRNSDGYKKIYVDGVLRGSNNGPNKTSTPSGIPDEIKIGEGVVGYIDDVRIYATVLSDDDVLNLYKNRVSIDGTKKAVFANSLSEVGYANNGNKIYMKSAGYDEVGGSDSDCILNDGTDLTYNERGLNVVVFDDRLDFYSVAYFDICNHNDWKIDGTLYDGAVDSQYLGQADAAMIDYLEGIPYGYVICISLRDYSAPYQQLKDFLSGKNYGSQYINGVDGRDNWAFICIKGEGKKAENFRPQYSGSVTLEHYFPERIEFPSAKGEIRAKQINNVGPVYGMEAWWKLDGDTRDYSGNKNHGTNSGADIDYGLSDKQCYNFNGTSNYISVPAMNYDSISVSLWFYRRSVDTISADSLWGGWYWNPDSSLQQGFDLRFYQNSTYILDFPLLTKDSANNVSYYNVAHDFVNDAGVLNKWIHVAGTYDTVTGNQKLYIDGVFEEGYTFPAGNTVVPLTYYSDMRIGYSRVNSGYFDGLIQDVRFYNRGLSAKEVEELYSAHKVSSSTILQVNDNATISSYGNLVEN